MAAASFSADAFDPKDPAAFYLSDDGREELEALADATLAVGGARLLVHRSVLSLQSRIMRNLFSDLQSGGGDGGSVRCKRKLEDQALVLEAPFQGATLLDTALFLRLCYRPDERTPANLAAVLSSLAGLPRLAQKLDNPLIQQAVCESMADKMQSAPLADLLEWVAAADTCQQPELRLRCIGEVARRLASRNSGLAGAFADAAIVAEQCDKSALAQLLGLVLAAGGQNIAGSLAAPSAAVEALQRAANPGSFEWAFEHYSQKPSGVGQSVEFPWFNVAGREWRFRVDPGAASEEAAGHLSVYLTCKHGGTRANFSITLLDQAAQGEQLQHIDK